jgi:hypothetical protein
MRASLFSELRRSLRSLATPAASHRLMLMQPSRHVSCPQAQLSCCAFTRLQPRACGLLGGRQPPKRRPSLARRLLSSQSPRDPYTVLDVPRGANQAAIKQGYFRAAKRNHPDVDKSPGAAVRFREISEAYDLLRDPARRSAFDARGFDPGGGGSSGFGGFGGGGPRRGERSSRPRQWEDEMFRKVWSDLGMADIDTYIARVQRELQVAVSAATSGDTRQAWQFASDHRFLLVGTIVPITLLFRSPGASILVFRMLGPLYALGRFLPPHLQWRLFSRMWVGAILYLERAVSRGSTGTQGRKR